MKRVLNLFLAVLLVCTVNGLGDLKAQSNNKVAQLEKLSAIENNPQKTIRKQTAAIRHSLKTATPLGRVGHTAEQFYTFCGSSGFQGMTDSSSLLADCFLRVVFYGGQFL